MLKRKTLLFYVVGVAIITLLAFSQAGASGLSCYAPCTQQELLEFTCAEDPIAGFRARIVKCGDQYPCIDGNGNSKFQWDICRTGGGKISHVDIAFPNFCSPNLKPIASSPACSQCYDPPCDVDRCVAPFDPSTGFDIGRTLTDIYKWDKVNPYGGTVSLTFESTVSATNGPMLIKSGRSARKWGQLEILTPTCPETAVPQQDEASLRKFRQTDGGTTCEITIDEEKLSKCSFDPDNGKVSCPEDPFEVTQISPETPLGLCTAEPVATLQLSIGGKTVTSIPVYEWFSTASSPGQFTYCYPSGYCAVFSF